VVVVPGRVRDVTTSGRNAPTTRVHHHNNDAMREHRDALTTRMHDHTAMQLVRVITTITRDKLQKKLS
jgi:outer membrane lipopolysaccharide assembly protein LptE/RlpB